MAHAPPVIMIRGGAFMMGDKAMGAERARAGLPGRRAMPGAVGFLDGVLRV